jgi:hypothetical protein
MQTLGNSKMFKTKNRRVGTLLRFQIVDDDESDDGGEHRDYDDTDDILCVTFR